MEEIFIETEFIKLDQLLKFAGIVQTGTDAKYFISEGLVLVDGKVETRRGRKIYDGMIVRVMLETEETVIVKKR
ncbi:putative S4 domain protein YaaA [Parvimonas sp. KA00067]|uniref:RNA-binding S4 domain-containing protein n=1 Tax=Parvimonas sp. KA00067 TaxID=1588755 RepID=UPI0007954317|nr:RNA-binding S4 domain-containing protein [Parvimonas sp. KA00067]KXB66316.1 putative S4 domain protein YaaA [Parvimonas sp. KA00067]